ncbi:MAG: ATP-binding protein [Myxococcales bacterium]|nr:ATP-binding protein [Myxococcales bacterium]
MFSAPSRRNPSTTPASAASPPSSTSTSTPPSWPSPPRSSTRSPRCASTVGASPRPSPGWPAASLTPSRRSPRTSPAWSPESAGSSPIARRSARPSTRPSRSRGRRSGGPCSAAEAPRRSLPHRVRPRSPVPADLLSEGTVLALGLLTKLREPRRPRLVLLDDIERGLHIGAQVELVKVLKALLERESDLQIICSTHSPTSLISSSPATSSSSRSMRTGPPTPNR